MGGFLVIESTRVFTWVFCTSHVFACQKIVPILRFSWNLDNRQTPPVSTGGFLFVCFTHYFEIYLKKE